jgi:hypothetical protein
MDSGGDISLTCIPSLRNRGQPRVGKCGLECCDAMDHGGGGLYHLVSSILQALYYGLTSMYTVPT